MLTQQPALTIDNTRRPWRYMLGSTGLWGVTDVLRDHGFIDPQFCTEEGRQRGLVVHLATAYLDQVRLDWRTLDRSLHGYVRGWEAIVLKMGWRVIECECPRCHPVYGFAGTPDRWLVDPAGTEWVVDIKTIGAGGGAAPAAARYQTAAYDLLLPRLPAGARARRRAAVELHPDGMARLIEHTDFADAGFFLAFLSTTKRRHHHGVIDGPAA